MTESVYYQGRLLSNEVNKLTFENCMIARIQVISTNKNLYYISYDGINWQLAHNNLSGFLLSTGMFYQDTSWSSAIKVELPGGGLEFVPLGSQILTSKGELIYSTRQVAYRKDGLTYYSAMIAPAGNGIVSMNLTSGATSMMSTSIAFEPSRLASNGSEILVMGWDSHRIITQSNTMSGVFSNPNSRSHYFYPVGEKWFAYDPTGGHVYYLTDYNSSTGFTWTLVTTIGTWLSDLIIVTDGDGTLLFRGAGAASVYRSNDGGASWTTITLPGSFTASTLGYFNGYFYLFGEKSSGGSVYKSVDGTTWSEVSSGLSFRFHPERCVTL